MWTAQTRTLAQIQNEVIKSHNSSTDTKKRKLHKHTVKKQPTGSFPPLKRWKKKRNFRVSCEWHSCQNSSFPCALCNCAAYHGPKLCRYSQYGLAMAATGVLLHGSSKTAVETTFSSFYALYSHTNAFPYHRSRPVHRAHKWKETHCWTTHKDASHFTHTHTCVYMCMSNLV